MKKFMLATRWFLINGAFLAVLIAGTVYQIQYAQNLAIFLVWFLSITSLVILIPSVVEQHWKTQGIINSVPRWLDHSFDFLVICILAATGFTFSAVAYSVHLMCVVSFKNQVQQLEDVKNQTAQS
jgi:hypothetical protein